MMRLRLMVVVFALMGIVVPVHAQTDACDPQAILEAFAQTDDIGVWAQGYSGCSPQTQRAVRTLATGYQLLNSEYLPFAAADNPTAFSSIWKWYQGSTSSLLYTLDAAINVVSIVAPSMSEQRDTIITAPVLAYPTSGDFTAQVTLNFSPLEPNNGAALGIRDAQDPTRWIRIAREGDNIIVSATTNGETTQVDSQPYEAGEEVVYLKIVRAGSLFTLSYSVENTEWRDVAVNYSLDLPADVEVYLTTYSPESAVTLARFNEMTVE